MKYEEPNEGESDHSNNDRAYDNNDDRIDLGAGLCSQVDHYIDHQSNNGEDNAGEKADEESIVSLAYTIVHERAVVIEHFNAVVTGWAVASAGWS